VLQTCPLTHGSKIHRHNEVVAKIARHGKTRGWVEEDDPHIRSPCGQLFKPDLVIHLPGGTTVIADVQVAWDSTNANAQNKTYRLSIRRLKDHGWVKSWYSPLIILGARRIWPRLYSDRSAILEIPPLFAAVA
jgi:hypothetical protein